MDTIEPEDFDVIVVGSGLVECLLAGSLVRAGNSVLLIDQTDVYGSDDASFTLAGLMGSEDPQLNPNICSASGQLQQSDPGQPQLPSPAMQLVRIPPPALPISGVEVWSVPKTDLGNTRSYILDLAPKVLYQGEPTVDALVSMRAHNYLEFKAVEGSYIWCGQQGLRRVPASRADIFRDRSLGLADKRGLMATLSACMEAHEQHSGRLAAAVSQDEPLAQVLSREGLSPLLQDVILYGIAMADWAQPPLQPPPPPPPLQQQLEQQLSTQQQSVQAVAGVCRHPQPQGGEGSLVTLPGFVGARAGCASLVLYTHSLGRFGAPGAFMAPAYGAGSLPEALVRHAAVHGAVTALRQALVGLVLGPQELRGEGAGGGAAAMGAAQQHQQREQQQGARGVDGSAAPPAGCAPAVGSTRPAPDPPLPSACSRPTSAAGAARAGEHADAADEGLAGGVGARASRTAVLGCLTAGGQLLRCKQALIAGPRVLSGLPGPISPSALPPSAAAAVAHSNCRSSNGSGGSGDGRPAVGSSASQQRPNRSNTKVPPLHTVLLSRAAAILDAPLQGAPEAAATLVLPPGTPGCSNLHPIRGLQLAPSLCVAPRGRYLLYLSTPASCGEPHASARADLERALQLLVECAGLQTTDGAVSEGVQAQGWQTGAYAASSQHEAHAQSLGPESITQAGRAGQEEGTGLHKCRQPARSSCGSGAAAATPTAADASPGEGRAQGGEGAVPAGSLQGGSSQDAGASAASSAAAHAGSGLARPRALQVHYYLQELSAPAGLAIATGAHTAAGTAGTASRETGQGGSWRTQDSDCQDVTAASAVPEGLVCCPGPSPSMMGCTAAVECAQALLARHFPGVPWVGARGGAGGPEEGEEEGGEQGGPQGADEEEDEDIAALQASLDQLKALQGEPV